MKIKARSHTPQLSQALQSQGFSPLMSRLFANRNVLDSSELDMSLGKLIAPQEMLGCVEAGMHLAQAIESQSGICIVADYDCDGATACAVALLGLEMMGAQNTQFIVPDRMLDGYGLTPNLARKVQATGAHWLLTVDNGIASVEGVQVAKNLGLQVIITDHHLPASVTPNADVIVNPNQKGCSFPSKNLAGVGVMFYVLLATRAQLRERKFFNAQRPEPKLDGLLPLVALGTVADVVSLDANNRRLVHQGLERIKRGQLTPGLASLIEIAGKDHRLLSAQDLGFALAPRINAAGRLSDMTLGIECLRSTDSTKARVLAEQLNEINQSRKDIESEMTEQALELAQSLIDDPDHLPSALCLFDPDFHEGVVGIVASRMKELYHRPTFVFAMSQAPGKEHLLKGSGRSISGFHLRDALDVMSKRYPQLITQFGGHAMAAGCTIEEDHLPLFEDAFQEVALSLLSSEMLTQELLTDGPLHAHELSLDVAHELKSHVWGQGFAHPLFVNEFEVLEQRVVGEKHLSVKLKFHQTEVAGIWFGNTEPLPSRTQLAYRLECDEWRGVEKIKLFIACKA